MGKLYRLETLIHQQLNILANDCDLSDKHVHYLHALHSDDCEQSDKLKANSNIVDISNNQYAVKGSRNYYYRGVVELEKHNLI